MWNIYKPQSLNSSGFVHLELLQLGPASINILLTGCGQLLCQIYSCIYCRYLRIHCFWAINYIELLSQF